ncbi:MAG: DUF3034 family protein [Pseudomonadota bacterium]
MPRHHRTRAALAAAALACAAPAGADTGKLLLTGGVSSIDGAAGGGISPWAVIGTNATQGETGVSAYATRLRTRNYGLSGYGAAVGWNNRVELSIARQDFSAAPAVALNGIAAFGVEPDLHLKLDVIGAKVRLLGEAILDNDSLVPQVSVGVLHKSLDAASARSVVDFLGAKTSGTEAYVSATKLFLAPGILVNGTLRYSNANQNGLLGFGAGAPGHDARTLRPEVSVAYLLRRDLAIGAEYRFKPNNLEPVGRAAGLGNALREDDWKDIFIAWAPAKNLSFTGAYVDLGRIVPGITGDRRQKGFYLSAQVAY